MNSPIKTPVAPATEADVTGIAMRVPQPDRKRSRQPGPITAYKGKSPKNALRTFTGIAVAMATLLSIGAQSAYAIDIDAGDWTPAPAGTTVGLLYLQAAQRNDLYAGGQRVPGSNGLDSQIGLLRAVHYFDILGTRANVNVVLPFGHLKGKDGTSSLGSASGVGDLMLVSALWGHMDQEAGTYVGVLNYLSLPTGDYDRHKALNLGENRWKWTIQPGFQFQMNDRWGADLTADITFHGHNDDFGAGASGVTMKQNPTVQVQGFLRYGLSPATTLNAGLSHVRTGETEVAGLDQNDSTRITKFQIGGSTWITPTTQIVLAAGRDLKVDGDAGALQFKESARLNFRLLKLF